MSHGSGMHTANVPSGGAFGFVSSQPARRPSVLRTAKRPSRQPTEPHVAHSALDRAARHVDPRLLEAAMNEVAEALLEEHEEQQAKRVVSQKTKRQDRIVHRTDIATTNPVQKPLASEDGTEQLLHDMANKIRSLETRLVTLETSGVRVPTTAVEDSKNPRLRKKYTTVLVPTLPAYDKPSPDAKILKAFAKNQVIVIGDEFVENSDGLWVTARTPGTAFDTGWVQAYDIHTSNQLLGDRRTIGL